MGETMIAECNKVVQEFTIIEDNEYDTELKGVRQNKHSVSDKTQGEPTNENEPTLTVDSLMAMTPLFQEEDVVRIAARHLFLSKVKSQPGVKSVFFSDHKKDPYEYLVDNNWFDFETFSILFVCQAISKCHDPYNLHALINAKKCDHHLNDIAESPEWKKVGKSETTGLIGC